MFQPLSQSLLQHFYGRHVASKAPPSLLAEISEFREEPNESIVILSQILAADVTFGYHSSFCRLKSVNGVGIENIYHLARVLDACTDEFVQFDMDRSARPRRPSGVARIQCPGRAWWSLAQSGRGTPGRGGPGTCSWPCSMRASACSVAMQVASSFQSCPN